MKFLFKTSLIAMFIFSFCACEKKNESITDQESQTQKAIQLSEKGHFQEALFLLNQELEKNPSERLQILKASVYAARAGIKVEKYWGFVVGYENLLGMNDPMPKDPLADFPAALREPLAKFKNEIAVLKQISERIERIPLVSGVQRDDLLLAQETLQNSQSSGARLYRGVLGIIVLKSSLLEAQQVITEASEAVKKPCTEKWDLGLQWIRFNLEILQGVLGDLQMAFPSQKQSFQGLQSQINSEGLSLEHLCPK